MALDPQIISGIAGAAGAIASAVLLRVGRRKGRAQEDTETTAVSLTKQLMSDQRRDLDRGRRRIRELEEAAVQQRRDHEAECVQLRAERDQYREELDYAHARIAQLGGP